ncbi:aldo/keto reductase [Pelagibius litoralis]|uniref:Aldo/keto reductase n=1 Tax=Pelagibius litoralis TaxID=374515 RepID=A0A967EYM8_9PROT|nr:aldo/keto reductase [Pelagibius litoralis]NIA69858.1 aldo/keto reductase [Pelagibius litoralis]
MDMRKLGRSGLTVSPICLGTMMFGDQTEEAEAKRIIDHARDQGVNFIDTADQYANGASEEIVGRAIAKNRDSWVLATKAGNPMKGADANGSGLGRKWLLKAIDDSLDRLDVDYVDIWYLHLDDYTTPLEETVSAVADVVGSGKATYWGVSNFRAWRICELIRLAEQAGLDRPVVCQPYYNAMTRVPEVEILPACEYYGLGVVPYSPLARGVLTGKYAPGATPAEGTRAARKDTRMMETEFREESLIIAQKIKKHAEAKGMTAGDFAVNWVLANPIVTSILAGPRTMEHWEGYVAALAHTFDADDEALLNDLVAPGHPSTPGYNDPRYPVTGRPGW